jgi:hypothetical protein
MEEFHVEKKQKLKITLWIVGIQDGLVGERVQIHAVMEHNDGRVLYYNNQKTAVTRVEN